MLNRLGLVTIGIVGVVGLFAVSLDAQNHVPTIIYYQGQLKQAGGTPVTDGQYNIIFTLYDAETAGNSVWTETREVQVYSGLFHALLGEPPGSSIDASVFPAGAARWLGIKVGTNPEMSPRQRIASVPYAFRADTVVPESIGSTELKSDSASLAKVSGNAMSVSGGNVNVTGALSGNGSGLTNLNGSNITAGTVSLARLDAAVATDSELSGHAAATTGIHGVGTGAVVGTTLSQTLTNKTLGSTNSIDGAAITTGTVADARIASTIARDSELANYLPLAGGTLTGNLTGKDIIAAGGNILIQPELTTVEGGQIELAGCGGKPSYYLDVYTTGEGNSNHKFRIHSQGKTLFDIDYDGVNVRTDWGLWIDHDLHVFGTAYHSGGCGDLAENVAVNPQHKGLEPGSVVCIDPAHPDRFTLCAKAYDTTVVGVVSADPNSLIEPSVTGPDGKKRGLSQSCDTIPLALVGRVDCLVDATTSAISIGDLLTSSGTPGHAMKAEPTMIDGKPFIPSGVLIGKALAPLPKGQKGKVKVFLSLR